MRKLSFVTLTFATLIVPAAAMASPAEGVLPPIEGIRFVHVATAQNTFGGATYLLHPKISADPSVILLVTQRYGTPGAGGVYNDHPIGVVYDAKSAVWFLRNEDATSVPLGAAFDVLALAPGSNAASHLTTVDNTESNYSDIAESVAPGASDLRVWITPADVGGATHHDRHTGVWRHGVDWSIFNEDETDMALGHEFNVAVSLPSARSVVHVATAGNSTGNLTYLDHPDLNGHPGAWLLATHNWSPPSGGSSVYADLATGVWYDPKAGRWTIFDQAGELAGAIPEGAAFNVLVDPNPALFVDDFESKSYCSWSAVAGATTCK